MKAQKEQVAKITVALPASMLAELDRQAREEHRSRSGQIQFFLSKLVARRASGSQSGQIPA